MESAAQNLVGNVGQLLAKEYELLRGVAGDVAELRDDLATMNALLRMQSEADDGAVDHFVREWMKQLREVAYDAEDCIDHYRLRIKLRPSYGPCAWLRTLLLRRRLAVEIRALRARAIATSERHARYGVNRDALRRSPTLLPAPLVPRFRSTPSRANDRANGHELVGIGEQADAMVKRLKERVEGSHELRVFSIVGFGGLGKTTLAMEVCRRLEEDFERQAMVSVSQAFEPRRDLNSLLKRVLEQVARPKRKNEEGFMEEEALGEIDNLNDDQLAKKLKESVINNRYLIVVDDVWSIRGWEAIRAVLPENNSDSRIIVTTRIETVANACSPGTDAGHFIHQMEALNLIDSKKLLISRVFGSENSSYPKELENIMDNILRKCGGLPLAIVSIASVLAGYRSSGGKDMWETIYRSIGYQMESNPTLEGMRHIVSLSYDHLPHELKSCMMYLSIFPEDYVIRKDRLLHRWIAEGLIPEKRGLTMLEVAQSFFDELLRRNLIFSLKDSSDILGPVYEGGKKASCQVHDMLLEVMVSKSLEANFVSLLGGQYDGMSYDRIRRLSVHASLEISRLREEREHADSHPENKMFGWRGSRHGTDVNMQHVRSLSIFEQVQGHSVLDQLDKFSLLRMLDLEDCQGVENKHVRYACKLHLLTFLSLRGTKISKVPSEISNLQHLQTFDIRYTQLDGLPETITELAKLERLEFTNRNYWSIMWKLPSRLSKMKALREVGFAVIENDVQTARELGKLEQLQELTIYVSKKIPNAEAEVLKELAKSLGKIYSLRSLNIGDISYSGTNLKFLHDLPEPPRLLQRMRITGNAGDRLPTWIGSLAYLVEMVLAYVYLDDDEPYGVLCNLPSLKTITMERDYYTGKELVARTSHSFPALINLTLSNLYGSIPLPSVLTFEEGSMSKLEKLLVNFFHYETTMVGIEHLTSLKEVNLCGRKGNTALNRALEEHKAESRRRSNPFQVVVKYE